MATRETALYVAYKLHCDTCGYKLSNEKIDPPDAANYVENFWDRQKKEVTDIAHKGHKWEYVSILKGATKDELDKWNEENNG